ncbi:hypothetical protein [Paracoccus sanguinis]|nr:hypothetical protein [Paracoccus sanguinis]
MRLDRLGLLSAPATLLMTTMLASAQVAPAPAAPPQTVGAGGEGQCHSAR